ncbi:MAG: hypothetical protein ACOZIN_13720 [Myxococcota bacterium]
MQCSSIAVAVVVLASGFAYAQGSMEKKPGVPQAGGMTDMSKMGPWTRKPSNEGKTKKEISEFLRQEEELMKKGDFEAMLSRIDFPVYMVTDNSKGVPMAKEHSREEYTTMMKPFYEDMPKDVKTTHKRDITVLSDSLVTYVDDFTVTMGKQKYSGRGQGLLVKRNGQWKWKSMVEAGWGDMAEPGVGGAEPPAPNGMKK